LNESTRSGELFDLFVESVQDYAVFMLDPSGHVATWNAGAERIKGYRADQIIGRHFSTFYTAEDLAAGKCEMELEVAARVGRFEDEGWRLRSDGARFWANVVISAIRGRDGELLGYSKITRDLTERRRAEEERTARLAAERANRMKDEFLAVLGHELRNPLAPIVTALELAQLSGNGQLSREHAVIDRQVKHMMRLVDDLLDISRITTGKVELRHRPLDLRAVVEKSLETVSPLLEQRRHRLEVAFPDDPVPVDGDESRLSQVFTNLVTNAAKYTEPGGELRISIAARAPWIEATVQDNGRGISAELLPRVFELFVQGDQGVERQPGGLGIGLPVVRSLVELHGGTVRAASAGPGRGSTFTVCLPAAAPGRPAAEAAPAVTDRAGPARRILVVDDNDDARTMLRAVLESRGHAVVAVADGPAALQAVRAFVPEVAILDIGLPVMDGFELASRLVTALAAKPRLIALTGYGQRNDRERSARAGFDVHLVKPVDLQELIATVEPAPVPAI
jgi:PAS domain S-box-containing protein